MANIRVIKETEVAKYAVGRSILDEEDIIETARNILNERHEQKAKNGAFTRPAMVKEYLQDITMGLDVEKFYTVMLDSQHRLIKLEESFTGTIGAATVYPREIVKRALQLGAAAVIVAHNHPSGDPEPSIADKRVTQRVKDALDTVDIALLDHFVIGSNRIVSFAERGIL